MTSSISADPDSPMMRLIDTRYDDGTEVVYKLNWILSCDACKRRGLADRCQHIARIVSFITETHMFLSLIPKRCTTILFKLCHPGKGE